MTSQDTKVSRRVDGPRFRQSFRENLERLAAQRYLYATAKTAQVWQMVVVAVVPAVFAIVGSLVTFKPVSGISTVAAVYGVCASLVDLYIISPFVERRREKAASIQEDFDQLVLSGTPAHVLVDRIVDRGEVHTFARRYLGKYGSLKGVQDWYPPEVNDLPTSAARVICLRSNCTWDRPLREAYRRVLIGIVCVETVVTVVVALMIGMTLEDFILSLGFPLMPLVLFCLRQIHANSLAIERLGNLRIIADLAWKALLKDGGKSSLVDDVADRMQEEIHRSRSSNPLVPDWFYRMYRPQQQKEMTISARELVDQYLQVWSGDTKTKP